MRKADRKQNKTTQVNDVSNFTTQVQNTVKLSPETEAVLAQSVAQSLTKTGMEHTPVEDMAAIHYVLQQFVEWYNVETKMNLQKPFLVQVGEYRMTTENYSKIYKGTWVDKQLVAPFKNAKGEGVVAIVMNPKHFNRKTVFILHDLAERLAELRLSELGKSYKSQGGRFNELWRDGVTLFGLTSQGEDTQYGWKYTEFTPEMKAKLVKNFLPTIDEKVFLLMASLSKPSGQAPPQSMVGFECDKCETKARALPQAKLTCTTGGHPPILMGRQKSGEEKREARRSQRDLEKSERLLKQASELA